MSDTASPPAPAAAVPVSKVNLRLLLISGKKSDLLVNPTDTIESVCKTIANAWPKEWAGETPPIGPENLKILLRGRFLERPSTVESNSIPAGDTTVVHVLVKNEAPAQAVTAKDPEKASGCSCIML